MLLLNIITIRLDTNYNNLQGSSGVSELTPVFSGVRVIRSVLFCVMFCRSLFVLLSFFFDCHTFVICVCCYALFYT